MARRLSVRRLASAIGSALADAKLAGLGAADVLAVMDAQLELFWGAASRRRA
jgi:hypothetical protein